MGMKFEIAAGYQGSCFSCDKDVWKDSGILEWIEFDEKIEGCKVLGIPEVTGCWTPVHKQCVREGAKTKEI